jgi:hypothetical protein
MIESGVRRILIRKIPILVLGKRETQRKLVKFVEGGVKNILSKTKVIAAFDVLV